MPPGGGHHHRSTSLKQANKKNKRTKASKRSFNRLAGGKVNTKVKRGEGAGSSLKSKAQLISSQKANRLNEARQRRKTSRSNFIQERRRVVSVVDSAASEGNVNSNNAGGVVPRIIGLISVSEREHDFEEQVRSFLAKSADHVVNDNDNNSIITAKYESFKKEGVLTMLTNSSAFKGMYVRTTEQDDTHDDDKTIAEKEDASVVAALDLCRVCDMVVFLLDGSDAEKQQAISVRSGMSIGGASQSQKSTSTSSTKQQQDYDHMVSSRGDRILSAVKAQGLPTPLVLLVNYEDDNDINAADDETMSLLSCQSFKSARRSGIKKRLELKKYVARFAMTEFGENSKVADLDIPNDDDNIEDDNMANDNETNDGVTKSSSLISLTRSKKLISGIGAKRDDYPSRAALIRTFCFLAASPAKWVTNMPRAYILSDGSNREDTTNATMENNSTTKGYVYKPDTKELKITGYVRGKAPFDVDSLVHIPNVGTFPVKCIERAKLRKSLSGQKKKSKENNKITDIAMDNKTTDNVDIVETTLLAEADPMNRESLEMFATPDALEGEQNLVGFDEEHNFDGEDPDEDDNDGFKRGISRPAGWNDYQSAWLDAIGGEGMDDEQQDHGELAFALNQKSSASVAGGVDDDMDDANDITAEERKTLLQQRRKDQKEDLMFPDELEIKEGEKAEERLARFRSLQSFRKSYWDPKENLPETYSSIYHFASFRATQSDVMADMKDLMDAAHVTWGGGASKDNNEEIDEIMNNEDDDEDLTDDLLVGCVSSGSYITITLEEVSANSYSRINPSSLLVAVSLLPHENKVSVMHMGLSQTTQCEPSYNDTSSPPVKSKDILTFRCGWRTWQGCPIFSQNNLNSDKHKFERFLPTGGAFFASSVFGPVTYTPCPVLVFREPQNYHSLAKGDSDFIKRRQLIAIGSVIGSDADRIIVKRVVLTGFPTRVHKRHAIVKYMFYDPEDINWFKPAGLTTKHGLQGNIIQSVGVHGTMKCLFNAPIKQHDTVCLPLYKRIYPKYAPTDNVSDDGATMIKNDLLVL